MNDIGDVERLEIKGISDAEGALVEPTALLLEIRRPSGVIETHEWPGEASEIVDVDDEVGSFYFLLKLEEAGIWQYRWTASGNADLVESGTTSAGVDPFDPLPDEDFTAAEIWGRSPFLKSLYPKGAGDGEFTLLVATTVPLVASLTGRSLAGMPGEAVPSEMRELALRAIAMKTEQFATALGTAQNRRKTIGTGNLRGFRAGSYGEDYFGPEEAAKAKRLDPDPILHELLWALATEEKRAEWLALWDPENFSAPAAIASAFEWGMRPGGY